MDLRPIPLQHIDRDPTYQVRQRWDPATDATLDALARSLAGPEGLLHPIVVVQRTTPTTFGRLYTLIAGWRRLAAAQRLGWRTILARVEPPCDLDTPATRLRLLAMAVRENTERQDLPPEDRRVAVQRLQALYTEVYGALAPTTPAEPTTGFTRWAAQVLCVTERTIGRTSSSPPSGWTASRQAGCSRPRRRPRRPQPCASPMPYAPAVLWWRPSLI